MKPRAAQVRQQQALARRSKLDEVMAAARLEAARNPNTRQHYSYGGLMQRRDPNRGIITQAEWNELVEKRKESGKLFRFILMLFVFVSVLLLVYFKYDEEFNLEVPQIESGRGFGEVMSTTSDNLDASNNLAKETITVSDLEEYYNALGVKSRIVPVQPHSSVDEEADRQRRLENYRVLQEIKNAYEKHQNKQGQLVHCGRSCESQNKQIELAYNKLASQVDRELFGVLLDVNDTKKARTVSSKTLTEKYKQKRDSIMKTEMDEEYRNMALEELKDAYDIIQDPSARKYYLLYGAKPPEFMRHVSARHGGWGQELALGISKYHIIFMWLDFLHKYIGIWGETGVLLIFFVLFIMRIPSAINQSKRFLEELELQEEQQNQDGNAVAEKGN